MWRWHSRLSILKCDLIGLDLFDLGFFGQELESLLGGAKLDVFAAARVLCRTL